MKNIRIIVTLTTIVVVFAILLTACKKSETPSQISDYSISLPVGGETLLKGIPAEIKWYAPMYTPVDIDLYKGSEHVLSIEKSFITSSVVYIWMISNVVPDGSDYHIKISNADDKNQFVINEVGFSIGTYVQVLDEFTDTRDGRKYKTTLIGNQWWMAENFRYESEEDSYWYFDDKSQHEVYGKLYTLDAAIRDAPEGWHLPTNDEWKELEVYLGSTAASSIKVNGPTGFDVLYGGYYNGCVNGFGHEGFEAHIWSDSKSAEYNPICLVVEKYSGTIARVETICHKASYVRYVKD